MLNQKFIVYGTAYSTIFFIEVLYNELKTNKNRPREFGLAKCRVPCDMRQILTLQQNCVFGFINF